MNERERYKIPVVKKQSEGTYYLIILSLKFEKNE